MRAPGRRTLASWVLATLVIGPMLLDPAAAAAFPPLWTDLEGGVAATLRDAGHVYSAPARLDPRSAWRVGGLLAAGALLVAADQEVLDAVQRHRDDALYAPVDEAGEFLEPVGHMGRTNKYYLGALAIGYFTGQDWLTRVSGRILESHLIAGAGKNLANVLVGRKRPFEGGGPYAFALDGGTSFPSGHASNSFQLATILAAETDSRPLKALAYSLAGTVALQRIASGNHWPSDVYFASLFGWSVARTVVARNEARRWAVAPLRDGGRWGAALAYRRAF